MTIPENYLNLSLIFEELRDEAPFFAVAVLVFEFFASAFSFPNPAETNESITVIQTASIVFESIE